MALTDEQIILLNNLIYADVGIKNGDTVQDIIDKIVRSNYKSTGLITSHDWVKIVTLVEKEGALLNYTVTNFKDEKNGMRVACFVDDESHPKDVNVVFRGTDGEYEWKDNFRGGYQSDTIQQERANEYIKSLPPEYGDQITVSGHSKGGNKAQYTAIVNERVGKCISIDGQGFSREFVNTHKEEIERNSYKITSISASKDVVNALLISIAGERIYIDCGEQDSLFGYHNPSILLDDNGELKPETTQWEIAILINKYTIYLNENLREPERSAAFDGFAKLVFLFFKDLDNELTDIPGMLFALIQGIGKLDNFLLESFGNYYGVNLEEVLLYSLSIICPLIFLDDYLKLKIERYEFITKEMLEFAETIKERLDKFGKKAAEYAKIFIDEITRFAKKVVDFYLRKHGANQISMSVDSNIDVDTNKLRYYADRLYRINERVVSIDKRLDKLYWKVGLLDLWNLLQADILTGYSWRLLQCKNCLNETASDFESAESLIVSQ